jgi:hypothetical protein
MSRESASASKRDALDMLLVRCPCLVDWMGAALGRMRPGSALRRRLMSLSIKRGFDAMARSDLELVLRRYDSNVEVWMRVWTGSGSAAAIEVMRAFAPSTETWTRPSKSGGGIFAPSSMAVIVSPFERTSSVSDAAAESRRR